MPRLELWLKRFSLPLELSSPLEGRAERQSGELLASTQGRS